MVSRMLKILKRPTETHVEFFKRRESKISDAITDSGVPSFQLLYWKACFNWVGSLLSALWRTQPPTSAVVGGHVSSSSRGLSPRSGTRDI